ncbi:NADase-type glycan-binding domain-containing protein [Streptomyces sp. NPDC057702]|uniref:NADase-type glycan-binding domain-containing protein n=1 Tax=unclassified Streptomyces TaxID=2593676 RepID=UPI0036CB15DB
MRRRGRARSGRLVRLTVILGVVAALGVGGYLLLPAGQHLVEDTRDKLRKSKPVNPRRTSATAQLPGHPVGNTTDRLRNRYWGVPGPGATVTYTFAKPFRLYDLIITNGASNSPQEYARQGRALRIDLAATTEDGHVVRRTLTLDDKPGPQPQGLRISEVTTVRLTLASPAGLTGGRHLALAEVEFFQRR